MSKLGWSLPAGCHTLPGEEPEPPIAARCPTCGRFIRMEPSRSEPVEDWIVDYVGNKVLAYAGVVDFYMCNNCQQETPEPIFVFA